MLSTVRDRGVAGKAMANGLGGTTQSFQNLRMALHIMCNPSIGGRIISQTKRTTEREVPKSTHSLSLLGVQRGAAAVCERARRRPVKMQK